LSSLYAVVRTTGIILDYISTISCHYYSPCSADRCDSDIWYPACDCQNTPNTCEYQDAWHPVSWDNLSGCQYDTVDWDEYNECTDDYCCPYSGFYVVDVFDNCDYCHESHCETGQGCVITDISDGGEYDDKFYSYSCNLDVGCISTLIFCNDYDPFTDDCDASVGCVFTLIGENSEDMCLTSHCYSSGGVYYTNVDCYAECTKEWCDCTFGCQFRDFYCEDYSECTEDSCDTKTGYTVTNVERDDYNSCTTDTYFPLTRCQHTDLDCDEDNTCTDDDRKYCCGDLNECTNDYSLKGWYENLIRMRTVDYCVPYAGTKENHDYFFDCGPQSLKRGEWCGRRGCTCEEL